MEKLYTEKIYSRKIPLWSELPELDLYMDQIIVLMEKYLCCSTEEKLITPSMINNYVKLGIVPPPIKKKYSKIHIAYLIIICSLKQVMPIADIKILIDEKLKDSSIEDLLNEYSKLQSEISKKVIEISDNYISKNSTSSAMYLASASSICRYTADLILKSQQ
ncbi:MAG: DUF1836 domain-containing protein [Clostridia bacterium]|nr:DUF1836 domain-containing protein [Clostridia bacterium]